MRPHNRRCHWILISRDSEMWLQQKMNEWNVHVGARVRDDNLDRSQLCHLWALHFIHSFFSKNLLCSAITKVYSIFKYIIV